MSPQIRSLVWKEYRERRASLALTTGWILCGMFYIVAYELAFRIRGPVGSFYGTCAVYVLFAAVFLAMRTSLGERTQGTLGFSAALPAGLRQLAAVRLGGAIVTLAGPIVLGAILLSIVLSTGAIEQSPRRPPRDPQYVDFTRRPSLSQAEAVGLTWECAAIVVAQGIELLLILAVIGARRRSEAHVGFIGAVVGFMWLTAMELQFVFRDSGYRTVFNWLAAVLPQSLVIPWSYGTPSGSYNDLEFASRVWGPLALNLLLLFGLSAWFIHRYAAAIPDNAGRKTWINWRPPAFFSRLPLRWPGRIASLAALDLRQSVPLALAGLALAFLMAVIEICGDVLPSREQEVSVAALACGVLPGSTWIVAMLWSAIVGSGIFGAELQPGLGNFWRSRPIATSSWFWVKFSVGLLAVLGVLDGVTIAVSWNSLYAGQSSRMSWTYIACMPLLHAMLYALAVLGVCSLRRPVIGVMCAILPVFLLTFVLEAIPANESFDPIIVYNNLYTAEVRNAGGLELSGHHYPLVYGTVAAIIVLAPLAAFRAVRNWDPARG